MTVAKTKERCFQNNHHLQQQIWQIWWPCEHFDDRVVALDYDIHTGSGMTWPPYSPDLTPCDFFLSGYRKDQVHRQQPQTMEELEQYISVACEAIRAEMFERVSANFLLRLRHIVAANGGYFENIIL